MFIELDVQGGVPIHEQIAQQIIAGIASGSLKPSKPLPSAKRLASDLRIKSQIVHKAYQGLLAEGFLQERYDGRTGLLVTSAEEMPRVTEAFLDRLQQQLRVLAGEARARGMTESEFSKVCVRIYRSDLARMGDALE
ncbi:GntR family transcriptional regulator [Paenibacillus sp. R14(2021)]|uniref:GntR family transcriptional regulator n=1 Tax=Paenibacillus sp. R14(2021) TaxID=2859228 RepID=UPI001C614634|nr:GntR family transcriptional regulator [Paenibacillus sp. R14(2021)]